MTQPTEYIKFADVAVQSCAYAEGRQGPQWQLEILIPPSKYPSRFWIDQSQTGDDMVQSGEYWAEFKRMGLKDGKDGSADWDYNWRLVTLYSQEPHPEGTCPHVNYNYYNFTAGQTPGPTPGAAQTAQRETQAAQAQYRQGQPQTQPAPRAVAGGSVPDAETAKRESIHRQVALKAAVEYAGQGDDLTPGGVVSWAQTFLDFLNDVQPEPETPEPVDPDPAPEEEANPFDEEPAE